MNDKVISDSIETIYKLIEDLRERIVKIEYTLERHENSLKSLSKAILELEEAQEEEKE